MARLEPFFPKSHGMARVDDLRVLSGIIFINRNGLRWGDKGIRPRIPGRKSRSTPIKHDKRRNRIEIMFGRLKNWRRAAMRYGRSPKVFLSAIAPAATVMFWL